MAVTIRTATPGDAAAIAPIYDHHARTGTASFDSEGLSALAWADKIVAITSRGWPFLVAERGGMVLGYAYATQFRDRAALPGPARTASMSPLTRSGRVSAQRFSTRSRAKRAPAALSKW